MNKPISACFSFVQMPGGEAFVRGNVLYDSAGDEQRFDYSFKVGDLPDASTPLEWMQMALAATCDGI